MHEKGKIIHFTLWSENSKTWRTEWNWKPKLSEEKNDHKKVSNPK